MIKEYILHPYDSIQVIDEPDGHIVPLSLQLDESENPVLWAIVEEGTSTKHTIRLVPTGGKIEGKLPSLFDYIGTLQYPNKMAMHYFLT